MTEEPQADAAARSHFNDMLDQPETAFLGLRGLLMAAQRAGDEDAALDYARRAYQIRPKTPWVVTTLFDLQVKRGLWREALATVEAGVKAGIYAGDDGKRRQVVTLLACSGAAGEAGESKSAIDFAKKASGLAPDFLPATLRPALVRRFLLSGSIRMRCGQLLTPQRMLMRSAARSAGLLLKSR